LPVTYLHRVRGGGLSVRSNWPTVFEAIVLSVVKTLTCLVVVDGVERCLKLSFVVEPEQIGIERIRVMRIAPGKDERPMMIGFRADLAERLEAIARRKR
jgi:hypothetical protein